MSDKDAAAGDASGTGSTKLGYGTVAGAAVGGGGAYAIFQLVHLDQIFGHTDNTVGMLYGLAVFSALSLFAIFAYGRATQRSEAEKTPMLQLIGAGTFCLALVASIGVLAFKSVVPSDPGTTNLGPVKLSTTFMHFKDIRGFKFSTGSVFGTPNAELKPMIIDGSEHPFSNDGTLELDVSNSRHQIMIDVDKLDDLKSAFETLSSSYTGLLQRQIVQQDTCGSEIATGHLSAVCISMLRQPNPGEPRT